MKNIIRIEFAIRDLATEFTGDYKAYDSILKEHLQEFMDACENNMRVNYTEILNFTLYDGIIGYHFDTFLNNIVSEACCEVLSKYTILEK